MYKFNKNEEAFERIKNFVVNFIKTNPLVEGIILELYADDISRLGLRIETNEHFRYIEKVTGKKIFAESNSISAKIDSLTWTMRAYEGAVETSTGVVAQEFTTVNCEAARIIAEEIKKLESIYSSISKKENAAFNEFIEKNNHDLDYKIGKIKETFGNNIDVTKAINKDDDFYRTKYEQLYYPTWILFNRFNKFKLETEEQRKQRMQYSLKKIDVLKR